MGNMTIHQVCECGSWYEEHPTETCQDFRSDPQNTTEALAEWWDNKRVLREQRQKDLIKEAVREVLDERLGMRG